MPAGPHGWNEGRDRRSAARTGLVFALSLTLSSCVAGGVPSASDLPLPPSYAEVRLQPYRFEHAPQVPPGRVVFVVRNLDTVVHELVLVALPEDFPSIQEQLRDEERRGVDTLVVMHDRAPGSRGVFATELNPGRYGFLCFVRDADGVDHAHKGMTSEFLVA